MGRNKRSSLKYMQPSLLHVKEERDIVYTPKYLAKFIVEHFQPSGLCLDPCKGHGEFLNFLPADSLWCEIEEGVDFFAFSNKVDWIISNPPYSGLLEWIRHSFKVADNIVYLVPTHRIWSSDSFLKDIHEWGGVKETLMLGTGSDYSFPFGHSLSAVHFKRGWGGDMMFTRYDSRLMDTYKAHY